MSNITLFVTQNAPFVKLIQLRQSNGEPVLLSGYTSYAIFVQYIGDATKYRIDCSIDEPETGIIKLSIDSDSTHLLPEGLMHYTIYLVPPTGDKLVIQYGQAKIMGTA